MNIKLTVFFQDPFWIGVFERIYENRLQTCKVVFGSEPKDYEVYEFIKHNFFSLMFGKPIEAEDFMERKINPKRMQREVKKEIVKSGVGTKAQEAIKLSMQQGKLERKKTTKEEREAEEERKFELRQLKRKEKKKGH